jgi:mannose-1-phosphate guanylyltransferase
MHSEAGAARLASAGTIPTTPVNSCGGSGTRLWPISRTLLQKQLSPVSDSNDAVGSRSAARVRISVGRCLAGEEHRFVSRSTARRGTEAQLIIVEPCSRKTAVAGLAAFCIATVVRARHRERLPLDMPWCGILKRLPERS